MRAGHLIFDVQTVSRLTHLFRDGAAHLLDPARPDVGKAAPMRLVDRPYDQPKWIGRRLRRRRRKRRADSVPRPRGKR